MAEFLVVLDNDPQNAQAHTYIELISQDLQSRQHAAVQQDRLQLLSSTSKRLENGRQDPRPIDTAILDTTQMERRTHEERWKAICDQADMEMQLGHLTAANDLILRILAEEPSYITAQQILIELQIRLHQVLERGGPDSPEEHYALDGFYAFGQADYAVAAQSWNKATTLIRQTYTPEEATRHIASLHYSPYQQIAQAHADEDRQVAQAHELFEEAARLFENGHYDKALQSFRQVAILNPEYPQLGENLARAEAAVERDRSARLGEKKRQEIANRIGQGLKALEMSRFNEAEQAFKSALALDENNSQLHSYLKMAQDEIKRRHDPIAAQQHYEAGLIAYASGRLEEAIQEWTIAVRMNPAYEKAENALAKVQKELALNSEKDLP
jgi:tetratricopeptide (TPR) repeat protein